MNAAGWWSWLTVVAVAIPLPGRCQEQPKEPRPAKARVDRHGDPLPERAIARLGSVRFRHDGAVHEVAFSADGKLLAASSDDGNKVVLWDRATGRKLREMRVDKRGMPPTQLRFSADGKRLYASSWYGRDVALHAWDTETGADAKGLPRLPADARAIGYSSDAREVILLHKDSEVVRWQIEKGEELGRYPKPRDALGVAARVGERVLVPQLDGRSVGMYDAAGRKQLWSMEATPARENNSVAVAFSPDGKLFAAGTSAGVISVRESVTGKTVHKLEAGAARFYALAISPDGRTLAGSSWDGPLRL
jgi:WD40 repeat protein